MDLEEIRNKVIEAAIKDYNNPAYNVLNLELLEGVLFLLEYTQGNALYTKEQAQEISKEIEYWIQLREEFLETIKILKNTQEQAALTPMNPITIKNMNRARNTLLNATSSNIQDFYASNSYLEEVKWLQNVDLSSQMFQKKDYNEIMSNIQKAFLKWQNEEASWQDFLTTTEDIITSYVVPTNEKIKINEILYEYYAKISNVLLKALHDSVEDAVGTISKADLNAFIPANSLVSKRKDELTNLINSIKGIEPNFNLADLFKYMEENAYLKWYKEEQKFSEEEIIQAHLASIRKDASLEDTILIYRMEQTNEKLEKTIGKFEQNNMQKAENKAGKGVTVPSENQEFETLCQKYVDIIDKISAATFSLESNYNKLLNLEPKVIEEIKGGNIIDLQTQTINPEASFLAFDSIYTEVKRGEETILSLKNVLNNLEIETYMTYHCFPFDAVKSKEIIYGSTVVNIDEVLQKRKETIEELKTLYEKSNNVLEKEVIKSVIVKEQGIMTSEITRKQNFNPAFDGPAYLKKYSTLISFVEMAEKQENLIEEQAQAKEPEEVIVKELKLNFNGVQSVGSNAFVLKEEEPIKISIVKNKLSIAFSQTLKEKLKDAKYQLEPFKRQKKGTEKIDREIEEKDGTEIWTYDLKDIDTKEFYLSIIFRDLVDSKKNITFNLIKKGVVNEQILNREPERTILAR